MLKLSRSFFNKSNYRTLTTDVLSTLQLKKRPLKKKKSINELAPGVYPVIAYTTAESYDLNKLINGLNKQDLYQPERLPHAEAIHATAKYPIDDELREIFFFAEGSVVLWNANDLEAENLLKFLNDHEIKPYPDDLIQKECEIMNYRYDKMGVQKNLDKNGIFLLKSPDNDDIIMDKYAISNAMVASVKLGVWEAILDGYIETIELLTEDLKSGKKIKLSRQDALKKHGELFALRHLINLSSDLLDTPDFYWENDKLEHLYLEICSYFCINKRTKVMNEKINHCVELIELLSSQLNDKHHIRLEWMIIVLIMVEVAFETIHYIDKYWS